MKKGSFHERDSDEIPRGKFVDLWISKAASRPDKHLVVGDREMHHSWIRKELPEVLHRLESVQKLIDPSKSLLNFDCDEPDF